MAATLNAVSCGIQNLWHLGWSEMLKSNGQNDSKIRSLADNNIETLFELRAVSEYFLGYT